MFYLNLKLIFLKTLLNERSTKHPPDPVIASVAKRMSMLIIKMVK